jgi:hypothetical protein
MIESNSCQIVVCPRLGRLDSNEMWKSVNDRENTTDLHDVSIACIFREKGYEEDKGVTVVVSSHPELVCIG